MALSLTFNNISDINSNISSNIRIIFFLGAQLLLNRPKEYIKHNNVVIPLANALVPPSFTVFKYGSNDIRFEDLYPCLYIPII